MVTLTIIRYRKRYIFFALLAMAIHRLPLWLNSNISFYKLLGCGKNGGFDKTPDWQQWGIVTVNNSTKEDIHELYGPFIARWLNAFGCECCTFFLQPIEGHGKWDGKEPFGKLSTQTDYNGPVAVLTRATIRVSKLAAFWKNVDGVTVKMPGAKGLVTSIGIGEIPWIKQATFSIWQNKEAMIEFAYQMKAHRNVIAKTRNENWYREELFVRFKPLKAIGTIKGIHPLKGMA